MVLGGGVGDGAITAENIFDTMKIVGSTRMLLLSLKTCST